MNSKDFFDKFSFKDILAYFLPGIATTLGIVVFLYQLKLIEIPETELDIFAGILFFLISFIIGLTLSGASHPIVSFFYWIKNMKKPEQLIPLESEVKLKQTLKKKLDIDIKDEWSGEYYIYCSILVRELLPDSFAYSYRQQGLRLMRTYMMFPILLWTINGIIHGINLFGDSIYNGILLIIISVLFGGLLLTNIWNRMHKNRKRAVKNVIASFMCLDTILEEKRKNK